MSTTTLSKSSGTIERDVDWLPVSAKIGELANSWANRHDIAAYAGSNAGQQNPACFIPSTVELEINVPKCFGEGTDPSEVGDLTERSVQFEFPRAVGAVFHEAMHARFSGWDLEAASRALTRSELNALLLLEEGRIEKLGLNIFPRNAGFLRSMALDIVVTDLMESASESDTHFAAGAAALTLARVDAGSLDASDVESIRDAIAEKLSPANLERLREIWLAAQATVLTSNVEDYYNLAREWDKIVREVAEENGDSVGDSAGDSASSGSGGSSTSGFISDMLEQLSESSDSATIAAYDDLSDVQTMEEWEQAAKDAASSARVRKDSEKTASEVFGSGTTEVKSGGTNSRLVQERLPTGPERAAAVQVSKLLEKAKYRDRSETTISSIVPPGRLRMRAAVQSSALKSKGIASSAEPWRRTVRKHVDDPTLTIGVMVDISGSMGAAMEPMATTAWVLSEASRRIQGKSAMVYFGTSVFPTLKPGQYLDRVTVYSAPDMTEKFDRAFKALNGGLNLLGGSGARMLVVVSDGEFTAIESEAARRWVEQCGRDGVAVLWITMNHRDRSASNIVKGTSAVMINVSGSAVDAAKAIGSAAAKALAAVG